MEQHLTAIVPVKNGSAYISTAIPRILQNLDSNDELIVIDDSSTDNSLELIREICKLDSRVISLQNPGEGIVDALNHGLDSAKFELIARFDIDDHYQLDRLSKQRNFLKANVVAVFCDYNVISEKFEPLGTIYSPVLSFATKLSLRNNQRTPHPGVLFSKSHCLAVGGYRKGDEGVEDLSLWLRLSTVGDLISIPESLFSYRIHENSTTWTKREEIQKKKAAILEEFPIQSNEVIQSRRRLGEAICFYKTLSGSYFRIALLIRELLLLGTFKDRILNLFYILVNLSRLNPFKLLQAVLYIGVQSKKRRKYRSI